MNGPKLTQIIGIDGISNHPCGHPTHPFPVCPGAVFAVGQTPKQADVFLTIKTAHACGCSQCNPNRAEEYPLFLPVSIYTYNELPQKYQPLVR